MQVIKLDVMDGKGLIEVAVADVVAAERIVQFFKWAAQDSPGVEVNRTCGECKNRAVSGHCISEKLAEDYGQSDNDKVDMLLYDYS